MVADIGKARRFANNEFVAELLAPIHEVQIEFEKNNKSVYRISKHFGVSQRLIHTQIRSITW